MKLSVSWLHKKENIFFFCVKHPPLKISGYATGPIINFSNIGLPLNNGHKFWVPRVVVVHRFGCILDFCNCSTSLEILISVINSPKIISTLTTNVAQIFKNHFKSQSNSNSFCWICPTFRRTDPSHRSVTPWIVADPFGSLHWPPRPCASPTPTPTSIRASLPPHYPGLSRTRYHKE